MIINVEKLMELELAGETEILGKLPAPGLLCPI
jgi:hypothetical protein